MPTDTQPASAALYIRLCPACETEVVGDSSDYCSCGASLARIDFIAKSPEPSMVASDQPVIKAEDTMIEPEDTMIEAKDAMIEAKDAVIEAKDAVIEPEEAVIEPEEAVIEAALAAAEIDEAFADTLIDLHADEDGFSGRPNPIDPIAADILPLPGIVFDKSSSLRCLHADCGAENPLNQQNCLYCSRPLGQNQALTGYVLPLANDDPHSLQDDLPAPLRSRFFLLESHPTGSAEADLLYVRRLDDYAKLMLKLFRRGIIPNQHLLAKLDEIQQPQILPILERGIANGRHWMLMEFCPHGNLRQLLDQGPLSSEQIHQLIDEICRALTAIHNHKIFHRDLRPENILVKNLAPLKLALIDFSIATIQETTQTFTSIERSLKYVPPEGLTGVITDKTDWWALGMIVMEAFLGRHPFDGLTEQEIGCRLSTQTVDTSMITDPSLQKLCAGLLTCDFNLAWGAHEVERWLRGDSTLTVAQSDQHIMSAVKPFVLNDSQSHTAQELATAILRNWDLAIKEWLRGNIAHWIDTELNDQNLSQTVQDLNETLHTSTDSRLLHFVRICDPKSPLIWQKRIVNTYAVLAAASSTEADQKWLVSLHKERVLALVNENEDPHLYKLSQFLDMAWPHFCQLWEKACQAYDTWQRRPRRKDRYGLSYTSYDDLAYVPTRPMPLPTAQNVIGKLLLVAGDPQYKEELRRKVELNADEIKKNCPWFFSIIDESAEFDATALVVAHHLLRFVQSSMDEDQRERQRITTQQQYIYSLMRQKFEETIGHIQRLTDPFPNTQNGCDVLFETTQTLDKLFEQANTIKSNDTDIAHWFDKIIQPLWPALTEARERLAAVLQYAFGANSEQFEEEPVQNEIFIIVTAFMLFLIIGLLGSWFAGTFVGIAVLSYWVAHVMKKRSSIRLAQDAYRKLLTKTDRLLQKESG